MYYSQCGEDKIIYEKYISKIKISNPIYLEMGAMDGIIYSNTYFFEQTLKWTGILIEPHKENFEMLQKNRPNNILFNNLISNEVNELEYINYQSGPLTGVAGIFQTLPQNNIETYYENDNEWQREQRKIHLRVDILKPITLVEVIKTSKTSKIDSFSLDVEGHEYNVLLSFDWSIPVNMFLIENNPDSLKINKLLIDKNYIFMEHIGPNSFYILRDFYENNFNN